jgi:hypothetical protein
MTNYFPAGAIIWLLIYLCKEFSKEESGVITVNKPQEIEPKKDVQYISNGRLLKDPHVFYYFDILSLNETKQLTDDTIENAASKRYELINKIEYNDKWPIASRDVNAAKGYLLDRWSYMSMLN